jgi:hypothetical protein
MEWQSGTSAPQKRAGRHFIGWSGPILPAVAQRLYDLYAQGQHWDMRGVLLVLPTSLAERRLNELLTIAADQAQATLYPRDGDAGLTTGTPVRCPASVC